MHVKLHKNRTNSGAALLLGVLVLVGIGLGGCAAKAIISKARKIEKQRQAQLTNELAEQRFAPPPPPPPVVETEPGAWAPVQSVPHFQIKTNAFDDDSGF